MNENQQIVILTAEPDLDFSEVRYELEKIAPDVRVHTKNLEPQAVLIGFDPAIVDIILKNPIVHGILSKLAELAGEATVTAIAKLFQRAKEKDRVWTTSSGKIRSKAIPLGIEIPLIHENLARPVRAEFKFPAELDESDIRKALGLIGSEVGKSHERLGERVRLEKEAADLLDKNGDYEGAMAIYNSEEMMKLRRDFVYVYLPKRGGWMDAHVLAEEEARRHLNAAS